MAVKKKSEKRIKKENYWKRLQVVAQKYKNVLFIDADNVSSCQISKLRVRLREIDAYMIMGKNVSTPTSICPPPASSNLHLINFHWDLPGRLSSGRSLDPRGPSESG